MTKKRKVIVLTGASRGLGRAMAEQLLGADVTLLALSRRPDAALDRSAAAGGFELEQWAIDIAKPEAAERVENWLGRFDGSQVESAALINNAGIVGRVGPIDLADAETLASVMQVDLVAPILLTRAFVRATRSWAVDKRILNVSSGAAQRAVAGWAAYCATKAAIDHFTRVVAVDESLQSNPVRIAAVAPGVIDTDMQAELRAAESTGFPEQSRFLDLKASGQLVSPGVAAQRLLACLFSPEFGSEPVTKLHS